MRRSFVFRLLRVVVCFGAECGASLCLHRFDFLHCASLAFCFHLLLFESLCFDVLPIASLRFASLRFGFLPLQRDYVPFVKLPNDVLRWDWAIVLIFSNLKSTDFSIGCSYMICLQLVSELKPREDFHGKRWTYLQCSQSLVL